MVLVIYLVNDLWSNENYNIKHYNFYYKFFSLDYHALHYMANLKRLQLFQNTDREGPHDTATKVPRRNILLFFSLAAFLPFLWYCMPIFLEKEMCNAFLWQTDIAGSIFLCLIRASHAYMYPWFPVLVVIWFSRPITPSSSQKIAPKQHYNLLH